MLLITSFPKVVTKNANRFLSVFKNKSQYKHFLEYLTGLIVCVKLNVQGINDAYVGHRDRSNKTRFFLDAEWSEREMNDMRIELMVEKLKGRSPKNIVLAIDDTLMEKTGKKIYGVGIHWDHTEKKYVLGHNTINSHLVARGGMHFPVDFQLYMKEKDVEKYPDHPGFKTKQEMARELIEQAVEYELPFNTALADSWFFNKENTDLIEEKGKGWVMGCKSNRLIRPGRNEKVSLSKYAERLSPQDFEPIEVGAKEKKTTYYVYGKTFSMSKQGRVKVVISYDNPDLKGDPNFFVTNRKEWDAKKILDTYQMRWPIECFYRDCKQNLGYGDCEMREERGIIRHWYLVLLAYSLLQLGAMDTTLCRWLNANVGTVGERCKFACAEVLRSFILWVLKQDKYNFGPDDILKNAFSSSRQLKFGFG